VLAIWNERASRSGDGAIEIEVRLAGGMDPDLERNRLAWIAPAEHNAAAAGGNLTMAVHLEDVLRRLLGIPGERVEA
jgi:hypothetical protein